MEEKKVYRVLLEDTRYFYFDLEASDAEQAKKKAQAALDAGYDALEDESLMQGFEIGQVQEIDREAADLDEDMEAEIAQLNV